MTEKKKTPWPKPKPETVNEAVTVNKDPSGRRLDSPPNPAKAESLPEESPTEPAQQPPLT